MTTIQTKLKRGNRAYAIKQAKEATRPDANLNHIDDAVRRYASHTDVIPAHGSFIDFLTFQAVLEYLTSLV